MCTLAAMARMSFPTIVVLLLCVHATVLAQGAPPDSVRLHDGSFVRGTIVEATPERVVIQLATGEIRTIPRADVEQVRTSDDGVPAQQPGSQPSPRTAPTTESPPTPTVPTADLPSVVVRLRLGEILRGVLVSDSESSVTIRLEDGTERTVPRSDIALLRRGTTDLRAARASSDGGSGDGRARFADGSEPIRGRSTSYGAGVRVTSAQEGLSLHRVTGSASIVVPTGRGAGMAQVDAFQLVCVAPCSTELPTGDYNFGVAQRDGQPQRVGGFVRVSGSSLHLDLTYDDRSGLRILGWVILGVGGLAGAAMLIASPFAGPRDCMFGGSYCRSTASIPLAIAGGVVFAGSLGAGFGLGMLNDSPGIRLE